MTKKGPRPHTWVVQGQPAHDQHVAWQRQHAQARYRKEPYLLTFAQFQTLWHEHWHEKGRGSDQYCLHRVDSTLPWQPDNVECIRRVDYLKFANEYRSTSQ